MFEVAWIKSLYSFSYIKRVPLLKQSQNLDLSYRADLDISLKRENEISLEWFRYLRSFKWHNVSMTDLFKKYFVSFSAHYVNIISFSTSVHAEKSIYMYFAKSLITQYVGISVLKIIFPHAHKSETSNFSL